MKLYLSRRHNGQYLLTLLKPIKEHVRGTQRDDFYPAYGEPIAVQNLCHEGIAAFGFDFPALETRRVEMNLTELE